MTTKITTRSIADSNITSVKLVDGVITFDHLGNIGHDTAPLVINRATEDSSYNLEIRNQGGISDTKFGGISFTQGATGSTPLGSIKLEHKNDGFPDLALFHRSGASTDSAALRIDGNTGMVLEPKKPVFWARGGSSLSFSGSSNYQKYVPTTVMVNNGDHYNSTTGTFTCPVDGLYMFLGRMNQTTQTTGPAAAYYKNGTNQYEVNIQYSVYYNNSTFSWIDECNKNDTINLYFTNYNNTTVTISGGRSGFGAILLG